MLSIPQRARVPGSLITSPFIRIRPAFISSSAFRLDARPARDKILLTRSFWGSFFFEEVLKAVEMNRKRIGPGVEEEVGLLEVLWEDIELTGMTF